MTGALTPAVRSRAPGIEAAAVDRALPATRVRLADGRVIVARLSAKRQRRIQLGVLHDATEGYVELAAGPRIDGRLRVTTRRDRAHFLPGGVTGQDGWLDALLTLAARHVARGEEVFIAPAVRCDRAAGKAHVTHTGWLWIDVDEPDGLPAVRALLGRKPAHLVIASGGSGGVHCYWRLARPLLASGDAIERAHEQLIWALGHERVNGVARPTVADLACKDRSRVMRLAGTVNGKSGRHAQILWADLALAAWQLTDLLGDLPQSPTSCRPRRPAMATLRDDPFKAIVPAEYFWRLARIEVPAGGVVSCPSPRHEDSTPSCVVGRGAGAGWYCFGCAAGGSIYDLASLLEGGPTGAGLRGEAFRRARELVHAAFGAHLA
jgi:hypothetical protein